MNALTRAADIPTTTDTPLPAAGRVVGAAAPDEPLLTVIEPRGTWNLADMLELDGALRELETADPRKGQIVMLRYFAGLTSEETGKAMGLSTPTIDREWRFIRSFLHTRLKDAGFA